MFVIKCKDNLELERPCRLGHPSAVPRVPSSGKELPLVLCCPPCTSALLSLGQGIAFKFTSQLCSCGAFCLLEKPNWRLSALSVSKAQLMARATRQPLLFAGCCPTSGSAGSPSGATEAASLSINKSELGRAMERQELFRAVKGDMAKANGLKRERKTIQDEKILTTRFARKHPQEHLEWLFLLWEDQGKEGEVAKTLSPRNKQTHSKNTNHYRETSSCSAVSEVVPSPRPGQKSVLSAVQNFSSHFSLSAKLACQKCGKKSPFF